MRKLFSKIHLWLSVPFGIIIAIVCLTGATLIFEPEINEMTMRHRYFVKEVTGQPIPLGELMKSVSRTLPDSVSITSVAISPDANRTYQVNLSKPRRAAVFVDPYTGEVVAKNERAPFFTFMFRMHRWLLDSMKPDGGVFWGKVIVGTSTLMFVFVLITGLVIWVPRTVKGLKNRLKIVANKGQHRFWYDLHVAGGFYATLLLLVMALTGLTWSFQWYRTGFYKVFGVETQQGPPHGATPAQQSATAPINTNQSLATNVEQRGEGRGGRPEGVSAENRLERGEGRPKRNEDNVEKGENRNEYKGERRAEGEQRGERRGTFRHWQQVYDEVSELNPTFKQITVADGTANVSFDRIGNQRASDKYTFDKQNGKITGIELYEDQSKSGKMRGWIYSVHVGNWGGVITRILYFIAALIGGTLPLTGYYLWIRRLIKKKQRRVQQVD